jgi:hypothetical protein
MQNQEMKSRFSKIRTSMNTDTCDWFQIQRKSKWQDFLGKKKKKKHVYFVDKQQLNVLLQMSDSASNTTDKLKAGQDQKDAPKQEENIESNEE